MKIAPQRARHVLTHLFSAALTVRTACRYQLLYNYQRKYESGGLLWQFFVNRVLVCCGIMVVFTG
jgi:hypothetical protein